MNNEQIRHMVSRFLMWKLPEHFSPDGGISFQPTYRGVGGTEQRHEPVGTNLLTATQATKMIEHMLEGLPAVPPHQQRVLQERAELGERRGKLLDFLTGDVIHTLPDEDQQLLQDQCNAMTAYLDIIERRIARF